MLKKIPPDPLIGSCRVIKKFAWKKYATSDKYWVLFRYYYIVEQFREPSLNERAYTGQFKPYYFFIVQYAMKDEAETLANILTLRDVKSNK